MVGIEPVWLPGGEHPGRRHEPRELIDVAISVVAGKVAPHPEHAVDAEPAMQRRLQRHPVEPGISFRIDHAPLVRQECAVAVGLDRSSFQHHLRLEGLEPKVPGDAPRHARVGVPRRILASPGVPVPADGAGPVTLGPFTRHEEHRAGVPDPRVARGNLDERHVWLVGERLPRRGQHVGRSDDPHRLMAGDKPREPFVGWGNRGKRPEERGLTVRPRDPCRGMRLPFRRQPEGGHGVTRPTGRGARRRHRSGDRGRTASASATTRCGRDRSPPRP